MSNRRPPRVMHGGAKLFAQARNLEALAKGPARALLDPTLVAQPVAEAQAQADLQALLRRLSVAERRVQYVERLVAVYEQQLTKLPEGHVYRTTVTEMMGKFRELLAQAEKDEP